MPQTGMDWWVILGVFVAVVGVIIASRQLKKQKSAVEQTMTNSRGSSQTVTDKNDSVRQKMDNVTDGDQNA